MGHDAADLQRVLQPVEQRDRAARRALHHAGIADAQVDDAVVYGYAGGGTIGHEITHGFDDEGRQFDAKGNLNDWWTTDDAKKFNARAAVMVEAVQRVRAAAGPAHQRQGEPRREHRRLRRRAARARRVQEDRAIQEGREDRRADADAAILPRLCDGLDDRRNARSVLRRASARATCTRRRSGACSARCRTFRSSTRRSM